MARNLGSHPWDAVRADSSTESYSQTVVNSDGTSAVETVLFQAGQDIASLPAWAQQQRLQRLQHQQRRQLQQQDRRERVEHRQRDMQERFQSGRLNTAVTPPQATNGSQPLSPGLLEVTERWVGTDGTEHVSTTRTSAQRRT